MSEIRGLSIKQPWVNLILSGQKTIETRSYKTNYRGAILICASQSPKIEPYGQAVALAYLYDCQPMKPEDEPAACIEVYDKAHSWFLKEIMAIKPFPFKGKLGVFPLNIEIWDSIFFRPKENPIQNMFNLPKGGGNQ